MRGYQEITTQAELEALLKRIAGFHDSMAKEFHIVNRGHVNPDHSMSMNHRFDARLLVQTQWPPFALEMVFIGVESLRMEDPGEYWGAIATVEDTPAPVEKRRIAFQFDRSLWIKAERLLVCDRSDWLGSVTRLGAEVPHPDCVPATEIVETWRQCSGCGDAFEAESSAIYATCPACGQMTELTEGTPKEA